METHQRTDELTDKKSYTGDSKKAPKGDFYMGQDKFACWKDEIFNAFDVGDMVTVEFTQTENTVGEKTYINRSITGMRKVSEEIGVDPAVPGEDKTVEIEYLKVEDTSKIQVSQTMKIGNLEYEITLRLLNGV